MKTTNAVIYLVAGVAIVAVAAFMLIGGYSTTTPTGEIAGSNDSNEQSSENTIVMTSSGFSPSSLEISVDDTITFVSEEGVHWPASAVHPTHTVYPGSDINKCGSGEEIFDSCRGLSAGESFSFTFNEAGTWAYHDHLNPSIFGRIIVQ